MSDRTLLNPVGEVFGRLTVVSEVPRTNPRKRRFLCLCACGTEVERELNKLRTGHTKSCGCLHREVRLANVKSAPRKGHSKHGMNKSPEHRAWVHMRQRCGNPNKREYKHYGGRGITVCERWLNSFETFLADVGMKPSPAHSLDRIDVNGHYEPGNVRWATQQQQAENTRAARLVTLDGKTQTISAWEREMGLSRGMVRGREARGWSIANAIKTPSVPGQKRVRAAAVIGATQDTGAAS